MRALIIDDEPSILNVLGRSLRLEDWDVRTALDGFSGLTAIDRSTPDVIILDVTLPDIDGRDLCRSLRERGNQIPILMLTARGSINDRVSGLDAGADDYLTKPFSGAELLARIRALVRRSGDKPVARRLRFRDLVLECGPRTATLSGRSLQLTRTEFSLLELLLRHSGEAVPRRHIYQEVWGFDMTTSSNSLDVYIGYLRRKLESGGAPRMLHTVRGVGFMLGAPKRLED
jgi:two-component system, OmpR family, response regulator MprA